MRRVTVQFNGEPVEGEELDFNIIREDWNEYECNDGTKLKMKTVVGRIIRLNKRNEEGEPIYFTKSSNLVTAQVPPHLMVEGV